MSESLMSNARTYLEEYEKGNNPSMEELEIEIYHELYNHFNEIQGKSFPKDDSMSEACDRLKDLRSLLIDNDWT